MGIGTKIKLIGEPFKLRKIIIRKQIIELRKGLTGRYASNIYTLKTN